MPFSRRSEQLKLETETELASLKFSLGKILTFNTSSSANRAGNLQNKSPVPMCQYSLPILFSSEQLLSYFTEKCQYIYFFFKEYLSDAIKGEKKHNTTSKQHRQSKPLGIAKYCASHEKETTWDGKI